jgi:predicted acylesterase/phospholipase RssA
MNSLDGYLERVEAPGRKRLLALDGGGIRGALTLEILAGLEDLIRRETDVGEDFVLADWFDYVAGTSTGAIIATGLAQGMPVSRLRTLYKNHGKEMFDRAFILNRFSYKYDPTRLRALLQDTLGADTTLGDPKLRTLLMMVLRNASTDSPWPLSNAPGARYNDRARPDCNLDLPLWQLVRASTAAPTYFPAEAIDVGDHHFVFVDGGMTTYNDPALQLFLMATLPEYGLGWQAGEDDVLLVSVGTGTTPKGDDHLRPDDMNLSTTLPCPPRDGCHCTSRICAALVFGCGLPRRCGGWTPRHGRSSQAADDVRRYRPELTRTANGQLSASIQRRSSGSTASTHRDLQRVAHHDFAYLDPAHLEGSRPVSPTVCRCASSSCRSAKADANNRLIQFDCVYGTW